jgi:hypothetical protein
MNIELYFGTPKIKIKFNNIKGFRGCPKKVRKTGEYSARMDKTSSSQAGRLEYINPLNN